MRLLICKDHEGHVHFGHKWTTAYYRTWFEGPFAGRHERLYRCPRCGAYAKYGRTQLIDFDQIRL